MLIRKLLILCMVGGPLLGLPRAAVAQAAAPMSSPPPAIILFIGDGMGTAHRQAAQWQSVGTGGSLTMDTLPASGHIGTASANAPVTDSAAAATALATGVKTDNGVIGQDPAGRDLVTILELAQAKGMAVGLVTTTQLAHATPAGFAAHVGDRNMMTEIAAQMAEAGIEVLLGGGEDEFLPVLRRGCFPEFGERLDGRDLVAEMVSAGYVAVCSAAELAARPVTTTHLIGFFADEGMARRYGPTPAQMTEAAIDVLSQDPDGFFLMVEGGQIDWAAHANDATATISDTLSLDAAVAVAQAYAQQSAVAPLIIVAADHETGGMALHLAPTGDPSEDGPYAMPDATPFWVTWATTAHTSADVPITAQGPQADLLTGDHENTHVFTVMHRVLFGKRVWLPVVVSGSAP